MKSQEVEQFAMADDDKPLPENVDIDAKDGDDNGKPEGTINTNNDAKSECSDLTDNNHETDEQAPKSFPQKVCFISMNRMQFCEENFLCRVSDINILFKQKSLRRRVDAAAMSQAIEA